MNIVFLQKIYVGCSLVNFALLDDRHVLVTPKHFAPSVDIYSFSRSAPDHRLCALEIPQESTGEFRISCQISTGGRPATPEGHFRADPSLSLVSVSLHTADIIYPVAREVPETFESLLGSPNSETRVHEWRGTSGFAEKAP